LRAEKGESVCALNPPQNRTLHKVFRIGGQTVAALAVEDRVFENGQLADVALYYFGQGDDGMVYYLGEDVDEYRNGKEAGHEGGLAPRCACGQARSVDAHSPKSG